MTCTPTRLELSNTAATSIQVTVTPDPGDQTTVSLSVPGLGLVQSASTTSGVALFLIAALTQSTNSLWDGTLQVESNAPADISVQVVETATAQVVGVTVSGADVSYCAPTGGGSGVQNLGDLARFSATTEATGCRWTRALPTRSTSTATPRSWRP